MYIFLKTYFGLIMRVKIFNFWDCFFFVVKATQRKRVFMISLLLCIKLYLLCFSNLLLLNALDPLLLYSRSPAPILRIHCSYTPDLLLIYNPDLLLLYSRYPAPILRINCSYTPDLLLLYFKSPSPKCFRSPDPLLLYSKPTAPILQTHCSYTPDLLLFYNPDLLFLYSQIPCSYTPNQLLLYSRSSAPLLQISFS